MNLFNFFETKYGISLNGIFWNKRVVTGTVKHSQFQQCCPYFFNTHIYIKIEMGNLSQDENHKLTKMIVALRWHFPRAYRWKC
jgi:hypothetical protein